MPTTIAIETQHRIVGSVHYIAITLAGQIDETNLDDLSAAIDPLVGSGTRYLAFDLTKLEFINSKVIGYLASLHGRLDAADQLMVFMQPNEHIFDIIELVGLTQIVPTFDTEAAALTAMQSGEL